MFEESSMLGSNTIDTPIDPNIRLMLKQGDQHLITQV